jgi:hypothetical protein
MTNSIRTLIVAIVVLTGLLYTFTIVYTIILTFTEIKVLDPLLGSTVTVIGGVLSTNLGAVLGVTLTPPLRDLKPLPTFLGLRSSIGLNTQRLTGTTQAETGQKLQIIACWVYVISLTLAFAGWIIAKLSGIRDAQIQPLLSELAKTLLGIMVGALTLALGRTQPEETLKANRKTS